jgi:hypothetical protein
MWLSSIARSQNAQLVFHPWSLDTTVCGKQIKYKKQKYIKIKAVRSGVGPIGLQIWLQGGHLGKPTMCYYS